MAVKFPFTSAFLCERVLFDQDRCLSAIRIVDIFQIPENAPPETTVQFFAVLVLKAAPPIPDEEVSIGVWLVRVSGERLRLPDPHGQPYKLHQLNPDTSAAGGVSIAIQLNLIPKHFGNCFIEFEVENEIVARIPFTIRRGPAIQAPQTH
jgi:hypothetical protein